MAEGPIRGVVGISLWNILIIMVIAVGGVILYNSTVAGRSVWGVTLARA